MRCWWLLSVAVAMAFSAGCQGLARPNWLHPGPAQYQQQRAHQFDPYPENEPGPAMVGTRPMEFRSPPPEVQKARPDQLRQRWFPWQLGGM